MIFLPSGRSGTGDVPVPPCVMPVAVELFKTDVTQPANGSAYAGFRAAKESGSAAPVAI